MTEIPVEEMYWVRTVIGLVIITLVIMWGF